MKRLAAALFLLLLCLLLPSWAQAALEEEGEAEQPDLSIEDGVDAWMGELDLTGWQAFFDTLPEEVRSLWAGVPVGDLIDTWAQSGMEGGWESLLRGLGDLLAGEARRGSGLLLAFMGLSILCALVNALSAGKESGVQETAGFVCRCFAMTVVLTGSLSAVTLVLGCMDALVQFMQLALPVLMTLLTAIGGVLSAGVFQPAMALLCDGVSTAMRTVVVPLSLFSSVLGMIGALSSRIRVHEMAGLMKRSAKWIIGAASSLYIGTTSVRGMGAAAYDGVTMRTAKYAASSLVPMVGGMVSDTMDTMLSCAVLVKNAAGLAAILLTVSVVLLPLIRLIAQMFLLRLSAALAEPIAGAQLPAMYGAAADMLSFLFAATVAVALMFLITIGLIMGVGSAAVAG